MMKKAISFVNGLDCLILSAVIIAGIAIIGASFGQMIMTYFAGYPILTGVLLNLFFIIVGIMLVRILENR